MKQLLLILSIFLSLTINAQEATLVKTTFTCENGTDKAIEDFNNGIYKVYSFGLLANIEDYGFNDYYEDYVFKKYGVLFSHRGCVVMSNDECYSNKMEELLYQKYGKDMFDIARKEAGLAFKQTLKFEKIKEKMDANDVFYFVHQPAKFKNGNSDLKDFILKTFGEVDSVNHDTNIRVWFIVEKDGSISNVELSSYGEDKPYQGQDADAIREKLQQMPKWQPGTHFSETVRTRESISIPKKLK